MSPIGMDIWPFTLAHFIVMGVFAVLAVLGILYGMRLKRRRLAAEEELEDHREAADTPPAAREAASPEVTSPAPGETKTTVHPAAPDAAIEPHPAPATPDAIDTNPVGDITQLKGLGPKLAARLAELGITRIDQIAAMSGAELDALDAQLGTFKGRPARDRWAEQARLLMADDRAGYEAEFGKLGR